MRKWKLWLIGFVTMFLAGAVSVGIALLFGDTFWMVAPLIVWFVLSQIFLVPRILKSGNKK